MILNQKNIVELNLRPNSSIFAQKKFVGLQKS